MITTWNYILRWSCVYQTCQKEPKTEVSKGLSERNMSLYHRRIQDFVGGGPRPPIGPPWTRAWLLCCRKLFSHTNSYLWRVFLRGGGGKAPLPPPPGSAPVNSVRNYLLGFRPISEVDILVQKAWISAVLQQIGIPVFQINARRQWPILYCKQYNIHMYR